jgi:hypothetical protein
VHRNTFVDFLGKHKKGGEARKNGQLTRTNGKARAEVYSPGSGHKIGKNTHTDKRKNPT